MNVSISADEFRTKLLELEKSKPSPTVTLYGEQYDRDELTNFVKTFNPELWGTRYSYTLHPDCETWDGKTNTFQAYKWDLYTEYVCQTPNGVKCKSEILHDVDTILKVDKPKFVKLLDCIVPLKLLKEYAYIWKGETIVLSKDYKGLKLQTDNLRNESRMCEPKMGDVRTSPWPWNTRELALTEINPPVTDDNKIKEVKPMTAKTQVPETQETPQKRTLEPFDPIKADAAAQDFKVELSAILSDGNRATDLCALFARYYLKAGHKRLGRILVKTEKE